MKHLPLIIVIGIAAGYAVFFSWFTVVRHDTTNSSRFDLGNAEQIVWNTVHGRPLVMTDPYDVKQVSRFAFHADPIYLLVAVPYAFFQKTETLLILQALIVASGILAAFLLARQVLHSAWWGVFVAAVMAVNPAMHWATIFDFHAVTLATAFIIWAVWGWASGHRRLGLIMLVLAVASKEEVGLTLVPLLLFWRTLRRWPWSRAAIIGAAAWSVLMFVLVMPLFQRGIQSADEVFSSTLGTSAASIIKHSIAHPAVLVRTLAAKQNIAYAWQVLRPFGGWPLLSPWSLGAVPEYVINALSLKPAQHLIISHYASTMIGWLVVGMVFAIDFIRRRARRHLQPRWQFAVSLLMVAWIGGWAAWSARVDGPLPGAENDAMYIARWQNAYAAPVAAWEKKIPSRAAVSVTNNIGSHFARREFLYSFPLGLERSDYAVVLEGHATPVVASQAEVTQAVQRLRQDPAWRVLEQNKDFTVLERLKS